ncbi:MAG: caspase family protein [Candidatus Competibacteraceae bacterium]|nr:caspase family protein [Candidatus Competibacteraceae bacterium]
MVEKAGFTLPVAPLINEQATKDAIESLLEDRLLAELQVDDQLVLFFAGHGHTRVAQVGDREIETGYLVPADAPAGVNERWSAYLPLDDFLSSVNVLPAKHILVILDACYSSFALGGEVDRFRGVDEFKHELSSKVSRRVITSARRNQLASDSGLLPNHSLFTGNLVDGLSWGKIDLDGNNLITSSEIGLYLQQSVGQASNSRQTLDFGAFGVDDRGELIISLSNQSFDALKARAYNALNRGLFSDFETLAEQLKNIRPRSPETLYLQYRLGLLQQDVNKALQAISSLTEINIPTGTIPLSDEDLWELSIQLPFWRQVLQLPDSETDIKIELLALSGDPVELQAFGETQAYILAPDTGFRLRFSNHAAKPQFIHSFLISKSGRMKPIRVWQSLSAATEGIASGVNSETLPLQKSGIQGIEEIRLIVASAAIEELLFPPDAKSRAPILSKESGLMSQRTQEVLRQAKRTTVRITTAITTPPN